MKTSRPNFIVTASFIAAAILCPRGQAAFVYENASEFTASGDFDGDGRQDVVIVDRASGTYRIGYQISPGSVTWVSPRASGIEAVSGFGLGHIAVTTMDTLAFTAPEANRINVITAENHNAAGLPISLFSPAIGPALVTAVDIGGAGNTAVDDFVIGSALNTGQPFQLEAARNLRLAGIALRRHDQTVTRCAARVFALDQTPGPRCGCSAARQAEDAEAVKRCIARTG